MIAAVILAAGQSRRMGQPKLVLPWGKLTVIEHVITVFQSAGIEDILVVTGGARQQVENLLQSYSIRFIHNEEYENGEMLSSLQRGLRNMKSETWATLVGLGDQPQVQKSTVRLVTETYRQNRSALVVPSFEKRRGHPWLVARPLWEELMSLRQPASPRDFLNNHSAEIDYVNVDTASILTDLDTPRDYDQFRPL
ncbi:MAG TPA: nucleotidyltransferase family protein [Anaerolineales bacterium]|nr:nucleotidyltransferase family protein [Anaerolineales bacterium]